MFQPHQRLGIRHDRDIVDGAKAGSVFEPKVSGEAIEYGRRDRITRGFQNRPVPQRAICGRDGNACGGMYGPGLVLQSRSRGDGKLPVVAGDSGPYGPGLPGDQRQRPVDLEVEDVERLRPGMAAPRGGQHHGDDAGGGQHRRTAGDVIGKPGLHRDVEMGLPLIRRRAGKGAEKREVLGRADQVGRLFSARQPEDLALPWIVRQIFSRDRPIESGGAADVVPGDVAAQRREGERVAGRRPTRHRRQHRPRLRCTAQRVVQIRLEHWLRTYFHEQADTTRHQGASRVGKAYGAPDVVPPVGGLQRRAVDNRSRHRGDERA